MIDFDAFSKIALECGRFGQINCCQRLKKLARSGHTGNNATEQSVDKLIDRAAFFRRFKFAKFISFQFYGNFV